MMNIRFLWIIVQVLTASIGQSDATTSSGDEILDILLSVTFPLRDANWYTENYKKMIDAKFNMSLLSLELEEMEDVMRVAEEQDWQSVVDLLDMETKLIEILGKKATRRGKRQYRKMLKVDRKVKEKGLSLGRSDPGMKNFKADPISKKNSRVGFIVEEATKYFKNRLKLSDRAVTGLVFLEEVSEYLKERFSKLVEGPLLTKGIESSKTSGICDPMHPYRTMNGTCNNLQYEYRGSIYTKFRRLLFSNYFGGVKDLRGSQEGANLPSSRLISTKINRNTNIRNSDLSALHMTFGQFLDHDITSTPVVKLDTMENGTIIKCCHPRLYKNKKSTKRGKKISCAPIAIPEDDYFYSPHGQTCMEFLRSTPAACMYLGPREQLNQQSAYLDGSVIYSVKQPLTEGDPLRTLKDGLLKEYVAMNGQHLLPVSKDAGMLCNTPDRMKNNEFCFISGDSRVNEVASLAFFHTIWCGEHNRIATILKSMRPYASDEELYQETRRIVTAELQHITFYEFLPTLIPPDLLKKHNLLPKTGREQTNSYDPKIDVSIANSFAAAAYRFGHSQIMDNVTKVSKNGIVSSGKLSAMFDPFLLYENNSVEDMARGGCRMSSFGMDSSFTKEVTDKLFKGKNEFGLDLLALNIQRGRDHGLPGYTKWLEKCGIMGITHFEDLLKVMPYENMVALKEVYKHVDDIDLYAGAISETPLQGGFLGPTFTCLLTDQFKRMKFGDRFWYEEMNQAGAFEPGQLEQLRKASLSRIVCDNVPELTELQRHLLRLPGPQNPVVSCDCENNSEIPCLDLSPWRP